MSIFELAIPDGQPFDLKLTLRCGQGHRWRKDGDWFTSVLGHDFVRIRQERKHEPLEYDCVAKRRPNILDHLRCQFRLYEDIESIHAYMIRREEALSQHPSRMAALIDSYRGLRVMSVNSWESLVYFIAAANAPIDVTHSRMDKIAKHFWEKYCKDQNWQHSRYPFPRPEQVGSERGLSILNGITFRYPQHRTYIHQAGQAVHVRNLYTTERAPPYRLRIAKLLSLQELKGVREKTSSCVSLFGLGYLEAFPVDTNIRQAWGRWYTKELADEEVRKKARKLFGPYAGYASQFLLVDQLEHRQSSKRKWTSIAS